MRSAKLLSLLMLSVLVGLYFLGKSDTPKSVHSTDINEASSIELNSRLVDLETNDISSINVSYLSKSFTIARSNSTTSITPDYQKFDGSYWSIREKKDAPVDITKLKSLISELQSLKTNEGILYKDAIKPITLDTGEETELSPGVYPPRASVTVTKTSGEIFSIFFGFKHPVADACYAVTESIVPPTEKEVFLHLVSNSQVEAIKQMASNLRVQNPFANLGDITSIEISTADTPPTRLSRSINGWVLDLEDTKFTANRQFIESLVKKIETLDVSTHEKSYIDDPVVGSLQIKNPIALDVILTNSDGKEYSLEIYVMMTIEEYVSGGELPQSYIIKFKGSNHEYVVYNTDYVDFMADINSFRDH